MEIYTAMTSATRLNCLTLSQKGCSIQSSDTTELHIIRAALYDNIQSLFRVELIIEKKLSKCIPLKASFYDKFAKTYHKFNLAPQVGLEPTTLRLTAACSTD